MSWQIKITSINWTVAPSGNQTVDISYRQGGSSGAYTTSGTAVFDASGAIVGTPDPFIIGGIDDSWTSVEVKSVNECNSVDVSTTFNKPA